MPSVRIHELAAELGVSCDEILDFLAGVGLKARSRSTVLAESVQARVRGRFAPGSRSPRRPRRRPRSTSHPTRPSSHGVGHAAPDGPPPLAAPGELCVDVLFVAPGAVPGSEDPRPEPETTPSGTVPRPSSHPDAVPTLPTPRRPIDDDAWAARGFTEEQARRWTQAGLGENEAALADRCRSAGLEPDQLGLLLSGRSALHRLRDGEGAPSVWARIAAGEHLRPSRLARS